MSTVKIHAQIELGKQRRSGRFPISLFVSVGGAKAVPEVTKWKVIPEQWDQVKRQFTRKMPNYTIENSLLQRAITARENDFLKEIVNGRQPKYTPAKKLRKVLYFEDYATEVAANDPRLRAEITRIRLYSSKKVTLDEMTDVWFRQYEAWMREHGRLPAGKQGVVADGLKLTGSSVSMNIKFLRRVTKQALREGFIEKDAFRSYKAPGRDPYKPFWLEGPQREKIIRLLDEPGRLSLCQYSTLNYFLLGILSGLRISDWETFLDDERLSEGGKIMVLRAEKNDEMIVLPVGPLLKRVIENIYRKQLKPMSRTTVQRHIKDILKLQKISFPTKRVGAHTARHSFGYLCAEGGLNCEETAILMGITPEVAKVYHHLTGKLITQRAMAIAI